MTKKLLIETMLVNSSNKLKTEGKENSPSYKLLEGIEGQPTSVRVRIPATVLDVRNENGRVYSTEVMKGAIDRCSEAIESRRLTCSVNDHPADSATVVPGEASHVVTKAWVENGYLMNDWDILETTNGKNLAALIKGEVSFGVSIRGLGEEDYDGNILPTYEYLGTDCVGNPSARIFTKGLPVESIKHAIKEERNMSKFKTLNEAVLYINKTADAIKAEKSKVEKYKMIAQVESDLSESSLSATDTYKVMREWDKASSELLTDEDTALREAINKAEKSKSEDIKRIGEKARKAIRIIKAAHDKVVGEHAKAMQRNKSLIARMMRTEKKLSLLERKYKESCVILSEQKYATEVAIVEAARIRKATENLIELASEYKYSTDIAIAEAAKYMKQASGKTKPAKAIKESRDPSKAISIKKGKAKPSLSETEAEDVAEKRFASARSGEHSLLGWM
jgi:hypothetical protein